MKIITVPDMMFSKLKTVLQDANFNLEASFTCRCNKDNVTFTQPIITKTSIRPLVMAKHTKIDLQETTAEIKER